MKIFCVRHYKATRNETQGSRQQPIRGIKWSSRDVA